MRPEDSRLRRRRAADGSAGSGQFRTSRDLRQQQNLFTNFTIGGANGDVGKRCDVERDNVSGDKGRTDVLSHWC